MVKTLPHLPQTGKELLAQQGHEEYGDSNQSFDIAKMLNDWHVDDNL